jgi:hypothetical protein
MESSKESRPTPRDSQPPLEVCGASGLETSTGKRLVESMVWAIWLVMTTVALVFIALTSHNIPFHEDWSLVRPLTGHATNFSNWLFAQNNEHRNPVPRLMLLGLLRLTGGDFRVGMVFNVLMLSASSAAMIGLVHKLRAGRTELADAFFPVFLLHLGNSENFGMMSWQVAFVFPMLVVLVALLLLVMPLTGEMAKQAGLMGFCLILLPLSGANGLLFVPFLAFWSIFCGIREGLDPHACSANRRLIMLRLVPSISSLVLLCLYFVHYHPSPFTQMKVTPIDSLRTAAEITTLGLGGGVSRFGVAGRVFTLGLVTSTLVLTMRACLRQCAFERRRALGVLLAIVTCLAAGLVTGWGRTSLYGSLPLRYTVLSVPLFCLIYFAWEIYGSNKSRRVMQITLFTVVCLLLPFNTFAGLIYQQAYRQGMRALERDILAGKSPQELAETHGKLLAAWWDPAALADRIRLLQASHMSGFARSPRKVPD